MKSEKNRIKKLYLSFILIYLFLISFSTLYAESSKFKIGSIKIIDGKLFNEIIHKLDNGTSEIKYTPLSNLFSSINDKINSKFSADIYVNNSSPVSLSYSLTKFTNSQDTIPITISIDLSSNYKKLINLLRKNDMKITQRAALEEYIFPMLNIYNKLNLKLFKDKNSFSLKMNLTGPEYPLYYKEKIDKTPSKLINLIERNNCIAIYYDVDDHKTSAKKQFKNSISQTSPLFLNMNNYFLKTTSLELFDIFDIIGDGLLFIFKNSNTELPKTAIIFSIGDSTVFYKLSTTIFKVFSDFKLNFSKINSSTYELIIDQKYPNPYLHSLFLTKFKNYIVVSNIKDYTQFFTKNSPKTFNFMNSSLFLTIELSLLKKEIIKIAKSGLLDVSKISNIISYLKKESIDGKLLLHVKNDINNTSIEINYEKRK